MKFLISFAVLAVFGSVHCDQECFRSMFRDCVRKPIPQDRMTLCDKLKYQIQCITEKAAVCKMSFYLDSLRLLGSIQSACTFKDDYNENKACYLRAINDNVCVAPINEAVKNVETSEDFIRSNKKVCNLFDTYSNCVQENVSKNCDDESFFISIVGHYTRLSNSFCKELILPSDEKDGGNDNFGIINVYASFAGMFSYL